ncbi:hypothetical protein N566_05095 [Streptomycetaceae bacterium MP113-05]|nr:hypothetical protein N566_05095 [Streptomycetaceae bacterium MP113-05]
MVPSLVLLVGMLLWGLSAAAGTIQTVDGARAGARAAARGEPPGVVREVARAVAPRGAEIDLSRDGGLVRVRVTARTAGPGALSLPLEAEAVALDEETFADPPAADQAAAAAAGAGSVTAQVGQGGIP